MDAVPGVGGEAPVLLLEDVHKVYNPGPLQVHVLKGVSWAVPVAGRAPCSTSSAAWTSRLAAAT
jgi:hypothetical protein